MKYQKGPNHWTVKVSKIYEMFIGKLADGGFCVSRKMKEFLKTKNIEAIVLYDRPPMNFKPLGKEERTQTFMDLGNELENLLPWNIFPEVKTPAECNPIFVKRRHLRKTLGSLPKVGEGGR